MVAALKIPLQVSCPNCVAANLPGSPYCSRCGAPLEGVTPGALSSGNLALPRASAEDPMKRFTADGQDPALVEQAHGRTSAILTSGESLEYVAVANRGALTHAPDCAVATNKRIILYRKKLMGKLEQDDFYWRDVSNATMKEGRTGVTFTLETIQGWHMSIELLPKGQAWRLYEVAVEYSEKLSEKLRGNAGPFSAAPDFAEVTSVPAAGIELAPRSFTLPAASPPQVPAQAVAPAVPTAQQPSALAESQAIPDRGPAPTNPTPESVLQAILQQAARDSGAPTRPMPLSAAAFQAPVADAQPVTFSEAGTDLNTRSMPRLNSLEQIAVFTGPLSGSQPYSQDSAPLSTYEPKPARPSNGAHITPENGAHRSTAAAFGSHESASPQVPERQEPREETGDVDPSYEDAAMPLPGSLTSGPLLEAAYDTGDAPYAEDLISGSLETQHLYANRAGDLADRITATNLATSNSGASAGERARRPAAATQKQRQHGVSGARANGRTASDDPVQKMQQLKAMLDAGLIDTADYEAKKSEILARL